MPLMDPLPAVAAALVLSFVFLSAAMHKAGDLKRFEATLANYRVLPAILVPGTARLVPVIEAVVGAALLMPPISRMAAIAAALLLAAYTLAIGVNLLRGRRAIDCGCGAPGRRQTLSGWLLIRNGALLGLSWACSIPVSDRALHWIDWSVIVPAAAAACLFYAAADQLLANRDLLVRAGGDG